MKKLSFGLILFTMIISINTMAFDNFHCKAATCQEFRYGLKNSPRQKEYVKVCHDTVRSLQDIPHKYGKCYVETTKTFNKACIYALVTTIQNCINGLSDLPESRARHYCGFKLMQNCARQIGLERFPLKSEYQRPDDDY